MHGSACPPIKPWILQKGWWIVIYHHLSQYYLKKFTLYFFSGLGTFSKITKLKKICDLNYGWMEIFSIFWLKDMKSALKNESKDTGCKNRDWNQGRSDFKPLCWENLGNLENLGFAVFRPKNLGKPGIRSF